MCGASLKLWEQELRVWRQREKKSDELVELLPQKHVFVKKQKHNHFRKPTKRRSAIQIKAKSGFCKIGAHPQTEAWAVTFLSPKSH